MQLMQSCTEAWCPQMRALSSLCPMGGLCGGLPHAQGLCGAQATSRSRRSRRRCGARMRPPLWRTRRTTWWACAPAGSWSWTSSCARPTARPPCCPLLSAGACRTPRRPRCASGKPPVAALPPVRGIVLFPPGRVWGSARTVHAHVRAVQHASLLSSLDSE